MKTDFDVVVVGAGIAGSSVVRLAQRRGLSTFMVADFPDPASTCALAVIRRRWQHGDDLRRTDFALDYYRSFGVLWPEGAVVTSFRPGGEFPKIESDWFLVSPTEPLVIPDMADRIERVLPETSEVVTSLGPVRGRLVVVAAGPGSRGLFPGRARGSFTEKWGATYVSPTAKIEPYLGYGLRAHWSTPYNAILAAESKGEVRVGSSVADSRAEAGVKADKILFNAIRAGMVTDVSDWSVRYGLRVMTDNGTSNGMPDWISSSTVVLTGFARCGYSIAPARAKEVLDRRFGEA